MILLHAKVNLSGDTDNPTINENRTTIGIGSTQQIVATKHHGHNNISSKFSNVLNTYREGSNPFLLGVSKLDGSTTFCGGVGYFIGKQLSSTTQSGSGEQVGYNFANQYRFILRTTNNALLGGFTLVFDDYNNERPNYFTINGETVIMPTTTEEQGGRIVTIPVPRIDYVLSSPSSEIEVIITSWDTPNRPLRIQGIYADLYLDIPFNSIISSNSMVKDRSNEDEPSFGILSNSGDLTFLDVENQYRVFSRRRMMADGCALQIYLENTNIPDKIEQIGDYYITDWEVQANGKTVDLTYEENLTKWQEIQIETPISWANNETALTLYKRLLSVTDDIYKRYTVPAITDVTTSFDGFKVTNALIEKLADITNKSYTVAVEGNTLWDKWQNFAVNFGLYIAKDGHGNVIMVDEV